jgi:signal transduction histidine kinase/CheY-like chemotaxis protein
VSDVALMQLARARELLVLATVALSAVALGTVVATDLRQAARDASELNQILSGGLNLIDDLHFETQEVRRILLYALYTSDANLQLQYADESRAASARVEQLLAHPARLVDIGRAGPSLENVRKAWTRYLEIRDEVIGLILEGSLREAVVLDEGQGRARFDEFRTAAAELKRTFEEDAALQVQDATARSERALQWLWILIVSTLAASAVGIHLVSRRAALERVEVELRRARDAAEQATRAKSDFLATMSHELRTPLNAVVGIADLLERTELSPRQRELMRLSRSSATTLLGLVTDILDYSRIEAGSISLTPSHFDIRVAVENAADEVTDPVARKGLDLGYLIEDDVPTKVIADEGRVRQVLLNLLSNAVKFTDRGEIAIHVSTAKVQDGGTQIVMSVRDTGRGIPEHLHAMVFERFSQIDATQSREHGGAGLGLAISHRLAHVLGGSLTLQSASGVGSTFTFSFSAEPAPTETAELEDTALVRGRRALVLVAPGIVERQIQWLLAKWGMTARIVTDDMVASADADRFDVVIVDADTRTVPEGRSSTGPALVAISRLRSGPFAEDACHVVKPIRARALYDALSAALASVEVTPAASHQPASMGLERRSVLLVEDDAANRRIAHLMLEELGLQAEEAVNGIEAIERARTQSYDVILMDLQMPGLDGLETTRRIRAGRNGQRPVVIALTASVMQDDQARCREAGMDGYLVKPLRLETLADALGKLSSRS